MYHYKLKGYPAGTRSGYYPEYLTPCQL